MYEVVLALTVAVWLAAVVLYLRQSFASIFHPITFYLAFHGLVFVVRPIFVVWQELSFIYTLYGFLPTLSEKITTLVIANLGLGAFIGGALVFGRHPMRFWRPAVERSQPRLRTAICIAFLLLLPVIVLSFRYALSSRISGVDMINLVADSSTHQKIYTSTSGYLVEANVMLGALGAALAWSFRFRLLALVPIASYLVLRLAVGWGRWSFVMAAASVILLFLFDLRRRWVPLIPIVAALVLMPAFSELGQHRDAVANWLLGRSQSTSPFARPNHHFFDGMDFANLEYLEYIVHTVPKQTGSFSYFVTNLEVFTAPIPRVLWPDKPVGPPIKPYRLQEFGNPIGISWTLPGEGWQDCGFLGVIIWCALAGCVWGWLYGWFVTGSESSFKLLIYSLLIPLSIQSFRDGTLITFVKFPLFFLLPIMVIAIVDRLLMWTSARYPRRRPGEVRPHGPQRPLRREPVAVSHDGPT